MDEPQSPNQQRAYLTYARLQSSLFRLSQPMEVPPTQAQIQARPPPRVPSQPHMPGQPTVRLPHRPCAIVPTDTNLPSGFVNTGQGSNIKLYQQNRRVDYVGAGRTDQDSAMVRTNYPIPTSCSVYYFEVKIIDQGRYGYIGIGICIQTSNSNRLPGWERGTFGYHSDDGFLFRGSSAGGAYGPTYKGGDVVGCCVDYANGVVFFTKNGIHLGVAARDIKTSYFPCVGLRTPDECIVANFGQEPFMFDFEGYLEEHKNQIKSKIKSSRVEKEAEIISTLVIDYLVHNCYSKTLERLSKDIGKYDSLKRRIDSSVMRKHIVNSVNEGDFDRAISMINRQYPGLLEKQKNVLFMIKCQIFVEMVGRAPLEEVLAYGKKEIATAPSPELEATLQEVFSIIAYPEPSTSPVAHLLDRNRRETLSQHINTLLLSQEAPAKWTALETNLRQLQSLSAELHQSSPASLLGLNPSNLL